jgi:hypothetical protein
VFGALVEFLVDPMRASGHWGDVIERPAPMGPRVGGTVTVRWRKTANGPRWELRGIYLGTDGAGRHQVSLRPAGGTQSMDPAMHGFTMTASDGAPFVPRRVREPELRT